MVLPENVSFIYADRVSTHGSIELHFILRYGIESTVELLDYLSLILSLYI